MSGKDKTDPVIPPHRSGAIEDPRLPLNPYSDDQQPWPGWWKRWSPSPTTASKAIRAATG